MRNRSARKDGFSLLGVGAVACVVCCAGPILGLLGGLSLVGVASTWFIGSAGLVVAAAAGGMWLWLRRRRPVESHPVPAAPVAVAPPTRRR